MRIWSGILLLHFATAVGIGQAPRPHNTSGLPDQPVALVRSLYRQVVIRHPGGIPTGDAMKVFAPYLSKGLLHRIDLFVACAADWNRLHNDPDEPVKPPFGVFESGIFSGANERTAPYFFHVERAKAERDGSTQVFVKLTWNDLPRYPNRESWRVAAAVIRESGHSVVDDVIYLKDEDRPGNTDWRLSQSLSQGCDGPRWVGLDHQPQVPQVPLRSRAVWVR